MLRVALSHDVDRVLKTYQAFSHGLKSLKKGHISDVVFHLKTFNNTKIYWNFEDVIDIENRFNVKSTFFFLNESIPFELFNLNNWKLSLGRYNIQESRIVNIIKWLNINGWEIGVHGSYNSYQNIELLIQEKKILEEIISEKIIGIRQHYLNLNPLTWKLQKEAGFLYDSSFGFTRQIGFLDKKYTPFSPFNNEFIVFPLVIMDSCFVKTLDKWIRLKQLILDAKTNNAVIVINWHTNNYNEREYVGFKRDYIELINCLKSEGAIFDTLKNFYLNDIKKNK
jgi:peptidoglycan/xylan/chitin deacetylase (PgdA/CDA1 family)